MRIYTKTYNQHYAVISKASPPLEVPADSKVCFAIPFPSEGFLERLIVWQTYDPNMGPQGPQGPQDVVGYDFEVELLNSRIPFPPGEYSTVQLAFDELTAYRIQRPPTAPLSQTAGGVLSLTDDDFGTGFRNVDGGWTLNQRLVYLVIHPIDALEPTFWNVTLQCRTDVG
jgi:hypothetical protein